MLRPSLSPLLTLLLQDFLRQLIGQQTATQPGYIFIVPPNLSNWKAGSTTRCLSLSRCRSHFRVW